MRSDFCGGGSWGGQGWVLLQELFNFNSSVYLHLNKYRLKWVGVILLRALTREHQIVIGR